MKISKILAGVSALAMVAAMAVTPVSAAETGYLYLVQKSWNKKAPADQTEGAVKFSDKTALGACDLNQWNSGTDKFNGQWAQYILSSDDLSSVTLKFTVETTADSTWEYHADDEAKPDDNIYQVFLALGKTETVAHKTINDTVEGTPADGDFVAATPQKFEYTYTADDIKAAIDDGSAKLQKNDDGSCTLGMNIQVGHITGALVTGEITADNLYKPADNNGGDTGSSSNAGGNSSTAGTTSSTAAGTTTSSKASTTSTTSTAATSSAAASDNTAATGATAGLALAGVALAGAAVVISKRK